jgi:hypothetical protein
MIFHLKVTDLNGQRISFGRVTGRYFGKIISTLILYIGFLMVAWDDKKRALHDQMAETLVYSSEKILLDRTLTKKRQTLLSILFGGACLLLIIWWFFLSQTTSSNLFKSNVPTPVVLYPSTTPGSPQLVLATPNENALDNEYQWDLLGAIQLATWEAQNNYPDMTLAKVQNMLQQYPSLSQPSTSQPTATQQTATFESWRYPPMAGAGTPINDHQSDQNTMSFVATQARNLSIPNPYQWEIYVMPSGTSVQTSRNYYANLALADSFRIGIDSEDVQGIYLLTLYKSIPAVRRLYVECWPETDKNPPLVMVIYQGF